MPNRIFFFDSDFEFVRVGASVCLIIGAISPIQIVKITYTGCLLGLGQMKKTMINSIMTVAVFQPLSNFVVIGLLHLCIWGIWISIFLSQFLWFILARLAYRRVRLKA